MSLNIHSWLYRGTLEVRCHHGSVCSDEIENWIRFMLNLVNFAVTSTNEQIDKLHPIDLLEEEKHAVHFVKRINRYKKSHKKVEVEQASNW
jgi:hypothetical protein